MPKRLLASILLIFVFVSLTPSASAQDDPERQRARQLYKEGKLTEALPLLEKLATRYPKDAQLLEFYGLVMVSQTAHLKDAAARKEARRRGRSRIGSAIDSRRTSSGT